MPAVDLKHRPCHVGTGIGGEQQQWPIQLFRLSQAPLRNTIDHRLSGIGFPKGRVQLGRDIAGRERVDAHAEARKFERSEEHTSELQSLMRISYAVFCLKKKNKQKM